MARVWMLEFQHSTQGCILPPTVSCFLLFYSNHIYFICNLRVPIGQWTMLPCHLCSHLTPMFHRSPTRAPALDGAPRPMSPGIRPRGSLLFNCRFWFPHVISARVFEPVLLPKRLERRRGGSSPAGGSLSALNGQKGNRPAAESRIWKPDVDHQHLRSSDARG